MTVMVKVEKVVSQREAVDMIKLYIAALAPTERKDKSLQLGDVVELDTGWIAVVSGFDSEGSTEVCYINGNGEISGPAYGYNIVKKVQL